MAFGLLGSIIPQVNRNEVFYTASSSELAIGKVSISSKNYNPVKIRLGITEDNINIEYLVYNKYVNYGETFETELIHLGNNQKLVARSSDPNVNFLFYGQTFADTTNPVKSGLLNSVLSTDFYKKILYTAPQDASAIVTLSVCNLDSQPGKARIGISNAGINAFDSSEYLEYDVEIGPNQTYTRTEVKLFSGQTLICSSSDDSNINFVCHGRLVYGVVSSNDLVVDGDARINGTLGVGTVFAREKLDIIGNGLISNNLSLGNDLSVGNNLTVANDLSVGDDLSIQGELAVGNRATISGRLTVQDSLIVSQSITGILSTSTLNQSLINLGSLPAMDGSRLTGIIISGGGGGVGTGGTDSTTIVSIGLSLSDNNVGQGPVNTLNFGDNLSVDVISGVGTVAFNDNINIVQNLTVANNKFSVNGITGNTQVAGTLGISSSLSVSGNINALNNKVINVGTATSSTDATNKNYVDIRSIVMSIALS
jgi:hypothetical protein